MSKAPGGAPLFVPGRLAAKALGALVASLASDLALPEASPEAVASFLAGCKDDRSFLSGGSPSLVEPGVCGRGSAGAAGRQSPSLVEPKPDVVIHPVLTHIVEFILRLVRNSWL